MTSAGRATAPGAPGHGDAGHSQVVELTFPRGPDLMFLARMTGAAVASRAGFGIDQVEDLRLAIDELCLTVAGDGPGDGSRLRLCFDWSDEAIRVEGVLEPGPDATAAPGPATGGAGDVPSAAELSERILDALVDEHGAEHEHEHGATRVWMVLRRHTAS